MNQKFEDVFPETLLKTRHQVSRRTTNITVTHLKYAHKFVAS